MDRIKKLQERFFTPHRLIPAGMYPYQSPPDAPEQYRLHLRIEPDGEGLLVVNASTVLHLNQTAAEFAYYLVQQKPDSEAVAEVARRYHVTKEQAEKDYLDLKDRLHTMIHTPDLDPVSYLDFERLTPHAHDLSAPLRLDCALTYRCSDGNDNSAPVERVRRELLTSEWKTILEKAWNAGIPHVIFTGGEPTLRDDLCDLVAQAESLGMVAGLLTDGLRLTDYQYLHELLKSGLDHLMLLLNPADDQSWEAVRDALAEDIFTTVHLTLTQELVEVAPALLDELSKMSVKSLSLSTDDISLSEKLLEVRKAAADRGLTLVWDLPVPYSSFHPVALELIENDRPPEGAGRAWLYVEPDGDVLPAQGSPIILGNLLADPWEKIWKK